MRTTKEIMGKALLDIAPMRAQLEENERILTMRVLDAFHKERVSTAHFAATTGYGYGDLGRDTLERVFARVMGAEMAWVRPQIVSGTHALALALFGLLRPGQRLLSAVGAPYDTLLPVIGITPTKGSLAEWGIAYDEAPLTEDGHPDLCAIEARLTPETHLVLVQRSRGYAWRPSLAMEEIAALCNLVHKKAPRAKVLVDNCYGEFTGLWEPLSVGADVMLGSLIKNPGGGLAPTGAYIAGDATSMEHIAARLTAPGIGGEVGSWAGGYQPFYQGLFMAPHTVCQALLTAILAARAFELAGFPVHPTFDAPRSDIIQAIRLGDAKRVIAFCQAIQRVSPVDGFVVPEPWEMPGYQDPVIMAAGTFVSGASIELSADAPMRPPYAVFLQGGLTFAHGQIAVEEALEAVRML